MLLKFSEAEREGKTEENGECGGDARAVCSPAGWSRGRW
jgi:hypothetical protein